MTEFCAIRIDEPEAEDQPGSPVSLPCSSPDDKRANTYVPNEISIPLPGTPTGSDGEPVGLKPIQDESHSDSLVGSTLSSSTEESQLERGLEAGQGMMRSSSGSSSEYSVKSTDMLIPLRAMEKRGGGDDSEVKSDSDRSS